MMATIPAVRMKKSSIRKSLKQNHLATIKRLVAASKDFDKRAGSIKAELRAMAASRDPLNGRAAQQLFLGFASELERSIYAAIRYSEQVAIRRTVAVVGADLVPENFGDREEVPAEQRPKILGLIGGLSAMVFIGMLAMRSGNKSGIVTAELAVNRLTTKAKRAVQWGGLAAANRATVEVIEVAKRVPVANRIPVARFLPIARRVYPPFILDVPTKRGEKSTVPGGTVEPEFILLPDDKKHRGYPGEEYRLPGDPVPPRKSIETLVGWQVISMLDDRVRPKHAERHGRIYYYNPRPERGERGFDDMPNPPYESPNDGGVLAHNCRCVLVPVFESREV